MCRSKVSHDTDSVSQRRVSGRYLHSGKVEQIFRSTDRYQMIISHRLLYSQLQVATTALLSLQISKVSISISEMKHIKMGLHCLHVDKVVLLTLEVTKGMIC